MTIKSKYTPQFEGAFPYLWTWEHFEKTGEYDPDLLSFLTGDMLEQRFVKMMKDEHPIFTSIPEIAQSDDPLQQEYNNRQPFGLLIGTGVTSKLIKEYLGEKEFFPNIQFKDSVAVQRYVKKIQKEESYCPTCCDKEKLCRSIPSLLQESYNEAKDIIQDIVQQHVQEAAKQRT